MNDLLNWETLKLYFDEDLLDIPEEVGFTQKYLEDSQAAIMSISKNLLPLDHYRRLEVLDYLFNGGVAKILNSKGYANATVCLVCRVDHFTHVANCQGSHYNC